MKKTSSAVLSPSERDVVNKKKTLTRELAKETRIAEIVKAFGKCKSASGIKITLEDGTVLTPTITEEIVYNALIAERDHSRGFQTILDMQKVLGENKDEVQVNVSLVDADLAKRALD